MRTHTQVLDDKIAYLVEPTPASMAAGLIELMAKEDLRNNLAFKAKEKVREKYTVEAFEHKLNHFYGLLENKIALSTSNPA